MKKVFITFLLLLTFSIGAIAQQIWQQDITVYPKPTVAITQTTVCEDAMVDLTFTGTAPFTLVYSVTPSAGLPTVFSMTATAGQVQLDSVSTNTEIGATTYTAQVRAGDAGTFNFALSSITDAHCVNTDIQAHQIIVVPKPNVVTTLDSALCLGEAISFTSDVANTTLYFTTTATPASLSGNFEFNIPTANTPTAQTSAAIGVFNFALNKIAVGGCEWNAGTADNQITIHDNTANADVIAYTTTVHALPTLTMDPVSGSTICPGTSVTLTFHGKPGFTFSTEPTVPSTVTFPNPVGPATWLTQTGTADDAGDYDYTMTFNAEVGNYNFSGNLTDLNGCVATGLTGNLTVRNYPTVTIDATPSDMCIGDKRIFTFANGTAPYTLNYTTTDWGNGTIVSDNSGYAELVADQAGTFEFHFVSVVDDIGCINTSNAVSSYTVIVNPLPTVAVNSATTVCEGGTIELAFTGTPNDTLTYAVSVNGGGFVNPTTIGLPNPIVATGTTETITAGQAGTFEFKFVSLVDSKGCSAVAPSNVTITVNPVPTVNFLSVPICEDGDLTLTFTGSGSNPTFTLDYKYNKEPSPSDLFWPDNIGLPTTFTPTAGATVNGVTTYTQTINPGTPGIFHFYLHTISDGSCANVNTGNPSWKWW